MNQNIIKKIHKYICNISLVINLFQILIFMIIFGNLFSLLYKKIFKINILQKYYPFCVNILLYVNGLNLVYELPLEVDVANNQYIFMSSHASFLDAIAIYRILGQILVTISKKALFKVPILRDAISYWGAVPIDRQNLQQAIQSYKNAREFALKRNLSFLVFPEGQRRRKDSDAEFSIQPLKKGPFHLAKEMKKDIVVVNIVGSRRLLKGVQFTPGNLFIRFSRPIKYDEIKNLEISEMIDKVNEKFRENDFLKSDEEIYHVDYDRWFFYMLFWIFYQICLWRSFKCALGFLF